MTFFNNYFRISVFLALACPGIAFGQVLLPDGKAPPLTSDSPYKVWVTSGGIKPTEQWNKSEINDPLEFLEACFVVTSHQADGGEYALLAKMTEGKVTEFIGWVNVKYLLNERTPLKVSMLSGQAGRLYQKISVINSRESIARALKLNQPDLAEVRVTIQPRLPKSEDDIRHRFKLSSMFFVYAEVDGHLLVGSAPQFDDATVKQVLKGWVPADRASRWNSRLGFEWDVDSSKSGRGEPGIVFAQYASTDSATSETGEQASRLDEQATKKAAREYLKKQLDANGLEQATGFTETFENGFSKPMQPDDPRFPILSEKPEIDLGTQNRLYKVGWRGGFAGNSSGNSVNLDSLRNRLKRLREESAQLDVLILIDHTESMVKYFPTVAQTVVSLFLDAQEQLVKRNVRISVCYYGDEEHSGNRAFEINPFVNLRASSSTEQQVLRDYAEQMRLKKNVTAGYFDNLSSQVRDQSPLLKLVQEVHTHEFGGGGDPREDFYKGLELCIKTAGFRPGAQKLLLVIGDVADKSGEGSEKTPTLIGAKRLGASVFERPGTPPSLLILRTNESNQPDAQLFAVQAKSIVDEVNRKLFELNGGRDVSNTEGELLSEVRLASDLSAVRKAIEVQFERLEQKAVQIEQQIGKLQIGQDVKSSIGPSLSRAMELYGIDISQFRALEGAEVYEEGFIWRDSRGGMPQLRTMVLLGEGEVDQLIGVLEDIVGKKVQPVLRKKSIFELAAGVVASSAGETGAPKSLVDQFFTKLDLNMNSELMKLSLEELQRMQENWNKNYDNFTDLEKQKYVAMRQDLEVKLMRLKDLREGFASDWVFKAVKVDDSGSTVDEITAVNRRKLQRGFQLPDDPTGTTWYYVDYEREIP